MSPPGDRLEQKSYVQIEFRLISDLQNQWATYFLFLKKSLKPLIYSDNSLKMKTTMTVTVISISKNSHL